MLAVLTLCAVISFAAGRKLFEPIQLSAAKFEVQKKATSTQQYANALLRPRNEAKWKAVYEHHPDSEEALWARLQLGVHHMTQQIPNLTAARDAFESLETETSINPDEWRELRFLTFLGLALVAEEQNRTADRDIFVNRQLLQAYSREFDSDVRGPRRLQLYHSRLREEFD